MVPSVNDVRLTGADGANPQWPRGPNTTGGYQLDGRKADLQEQALGALESHAQITNAPRARFLDDLAAFQNVLFSSPRARALADAVRAGVTPLPDVDPPLSALAQQGKVVFTRACAQCHGGPGQSTTQAPLPLRFHDISSQCPRPVDTVVPARFTFAPCPPRLARNARTYEITLANGTVVRRVSSDPGRALLTGFVGGPAARRRLEQARRQRTARDREDGALLPQQQRRHARAGGRALHRVLPAGAGDGAARVWCRHSRRPMACTSTASRCPKKPPRWWPI